MSVLLYQQNFPLLKVTRILRTYRNLPEKKKWHLFVWKAGIREWLAETNCLHTRGGREQGKREEEEGKEGRDVTSLRNLSSHCCGFHSTDHCGVFPSVVSHQLVHQNLIQYRQNRGYRDALRVLRVSIVCKYFLRVSMFMDVSTAL